MYCILINEWFFFVVTDWYIDRGWIRYAWGIAHKEPRVRLAVYINWCCLAIKFHHMSEILWTFIVLFGRVYVKKFYFFLF